MCGALSTVSGRSDPGLPEATRSAHQSVIATEARHEDLLLSQGQLLGSGHVGEELVNPMSPAGPPSSSLSSSSSLSLSLSATKHACLFRLARLCCCACRPMSSTWHLEHGELRKWSLCTPYNGTPYSRKDRVMNE